MSANNTSTAQNDALADAQADIHLALAYVSGQGQPQNISRGVQLMRKAAVNGAKQAQFMLGKWYAQGGPLEPDEAEAIFWLRKSASLGHEPAVHMLGQLGVVWRAPTDATKQATPTGAAPPNKQNSPVAMALNMELTPLAAVAPTPAPAPAEAKVRITRAQMDAWTDEAEDYLNGGSSVAEVMHLLKEQGCTPKLREQLVRKAGDKVRARHRKEGLRSLLLGIGGAALGIVFTLACTGQIHLGGWVVYSVKGALAGVIFAVTGTVWAVTGIYKTLTGSTVEAAPPGWQSVD